MGTVLLDRTIDQYRELAQLNAEIEQAVYQGDHERIDQLCLSVGELQEAVRADDSAVLALLRQQGDGQDGRVLELLSLMQEIQERNQRLLPHLNAVLAVQQSDGGAWSSTATSRRWCRPAGASARPTDRPGRALRRPPRPAVKKIFPSRCAYGKVASISQPPSSSR